ncbi:MAG: Xaa-Pro peptidase family protein, partial [Gemmatimonadota bacterium]
AMAAAAEALRRAAVRGGALFLDGEPLTSERLRRRLHRVLLEADCTGQHTIVAGGEQACDPHDEGHGPLRAGEPIIVDIFPRAAASGYYGDITRTFVRGPVPPPVRRLWDAVREAQATALGGIRAGASGRDLHAQVEAVFTGRGYATGEANGHMQGFFHGTGHGVGLEIHEAPSIGKAGTRLEPGHAVTVEPGLYYPGVGGVRLEDLVLVRDGGCHNLTTFPLDLEP